MDPRSEQWNETNTRDSEVDLGAVFRQYGPEYERVRDMPLQQRKVMRAVASCRTSILGGHLERCPNCDFQRPAYNSCRNTHCPKCQGAKRLEWVESRMQELLPVPYFHCVFTLPDTFHDLHYTQYRELHNSLFRASSQTLLSFFRELGAEPAITAVLHTWGQTVCLHPHVHMLVTGGGLSFDRSRWISTGKDRLFDVYAMSDEFKRRFLREIGKRIPSFTVPEKTKDKDWVVHCTKPLAGPDKVVEYLARYTYRSAISDRRISGMDNGRVSFTYKDYNDTDERDLPENKTMTLDAHEFIRRFLQHIPPKNFRRIRLYGLLAGSNRAAKLSAAREVLPAEHSEHSEQPESSEAQPQAEPENLCPYCRMDSLRKEPLPSPRGPPPITFRNEYRRFDHAA